MSQKGGARTLWACSSTGSPRGAGLGSSGLGPACFSPRVITGAAGALQGPQGDCRLLPGEDPAVAVLPCGRQGPPGSAQGYVDMSAQPPTLNKPHQPRHRHRGMTLTEFCFLCHLFWGSVSGLWYNPLHKFPAAIHLCDEGAATEADAPGFSRLRPFCQAPNCWDFQAAKCQLTTCNNNTLTVYLPGLQMA